MSDKVLHFFLFTGGIAFFAVVRATAERAVNRACVICGHKRFKKKYKSWA